MLTEADLDLITADLIESIRVRLRSDVPLGIFLSSGIDSILVATLAAKELDCRALAFTVKFSGDEVADESGAATRIAEHLGLPHKLVVSDEDPLRQNPDLFFDLYGDPNDNLTVAAAYQMSLLAASTLKVALTGVGGDEMFYGYKKYHVIYRLRRWLRIPLPIRRIFSGILSQISPAKFDLLHNLSRRPDADLFFAIKNYPFNQWLERLSQIEEVKNRCFPGTMPLLLSSRYFDLTKTMPYTFIPSIERASMRASLEVRTPYLNRKLFKTISSFDQRAFLAGGQKAVLRAILQRYLPEKLFDLPKRGFNYPIQPILDQFTLDDGINLPGISNQAKLEAWEKRTQKGWSTLAVRLAVLEHYLAQKTA